MADIPILRFILPIVIGILISHYLPGFWELSAALILIAFCIIIISHSLLKRRINLKLQFLSSAFIYIAFGSLAYLHHTASDMDRSPNFYSPIENDILVLQLDDLSRKNSKFQTAELSIVNSSENRHKVFAKVRAKIELDSSKPALKINDKILVDGTLQEIKSSLQPFLFDEKSYYSSKNIDYQLKINKEYWIPYEQAKPSLLNSAIDIRSFLVSKVNARIENSELSGYLLALTLGDRKTLSQEVKQSFISTGSMHVLAVSGMHVGVLFVVLSFLLRFNDRQKSILKALFIILVIWLYAFITGMGPPVQRASLMLTIIMLGKALSRGSNNYNALMLSAMLILLVDPQALFTLSFQFSFIAVLSIMMFYKKIKLLILFENAVANMTWSLCALSISAQVLTLPLSIYYFHQFPVVFVLSNILIIPYVIIQYHIGLFYVIAAIHIPLLNSALEFVLELLFQFTLNLNEFLSELPYAMIESIHLEFTDVLGYYLLLLLVFLIALKRHAIITSILFVALSIWLISPLNVNQVKTQVASFDFYGLKNLLIRAEHQVYFIADTKLINNSYFISRYFNNYLDYYGIKNAKLLPIEILNRNAELDRCLYIHHGLIYFADKSVFVKLGDLYDLQIDVDVYINMYKHTNIVEASNALTYERFVLN